MAISKAIGVNLVPCESSNIVAYGWVKDEIWVLFKGNNLYCYYNQPKDKYDALCSAESKGKWVNEHLVKSGAKYEGFDVT